MRDIYGTINQMTYATDHLKSTMDNLAAVQRDLLHDKCYNLSYLSQEVCSMMQNTCQSILALDEMINHLNKTITNNKKKTEQS